MSVIVDGKDGEYSVQFRPFKDGVQVRVGKEDRSVWYQVTVPWRLFRKIMAFVEMEKRGVES